MPPRKVTKTKTFAGCWTCRRRKVKCDNYRPRCRRCGENCEGYDVDLYWMDGKADRPCSVKRKAMLIHDPLLPLWVDLSEIDRKLDQLEEMVNAVGAGLIGAFSAFPVDKDHEQDEEQVIETDFLYEEEIVRRSSPLPLDTAVILGHGLSIYVDPAMAELMHNYIHVVADLLQPAHHTHNPYRSLYVPKAIEAASGNLFLGAGGIPSQAGTALFHALLAVSAFHLHRHQPDQERYGRQGRMHRIKAIEGLQWSLAEPDNGKDYHTTMSAMLSMVSIDLMEGSMSDFWIHLDGCDKLRSIMQTRQGYNMESPRTEQLLTICAFMSTLSRSTDPYLPSKRWTRDAPSAPIRDLLETSPFRTDDHSLEFTYGITATLARYMDLIICISQHLSYYENRNLLPPSSLRHALSSLHEALTTWSITDEPLTSVNEGDHETLSLVTCHILAFHAALVVYFYTRTNWERYYLHGDSRSSDPSSNDVLRHYNRISVTNLLAAEALKSSCGSRAGWNAMAPIVWPGFIAACEAELDEQPLWRTWWAGVQRYSIGSIAILWEVVQEVWQDHAEGEASERPRWLRVLRRSGRRVMSGG
ncbi:fungal-specific transcription factor domain-containing protein [Aspergillus heterothallicus]